MKIENIFYFLKKNNIEFKKGDYLKSFDRYIKVNQYMFNYGCAIYNGKFFIPLNIKLSMYNYLYSSFIFTKNIDIKRLPRKYEYKYKKKKKKK